MQEFINRTVYTSERLRTAKNRIRNLTDQLVGPLPEVEALKPPGIVPDPFLIQALDRGINENHSELDQLFEQIERLERALDIQPSNLPAAIPQGAKRSLY